MQVETCPACRSGGRDVNYRLMVSCADTDWERARSYTRVRFTGRFLTDASKIYALFTHRHRITFNGADITGSDVWTENSQYTAAILHSIYPLKFYVSVYFYCSVVQYSMTKRNVIFYGTIFFTVYRILCHVWRRSIDYIRRRRIKRTR